MITIILVLLFIIANAHSNQSDSIPIAEYCVGYGKKVFCDSYDVYYDYGDNCCNKTCDSTDIHLHLKTSFREPFGITACPSYSGSESDSSRYSNFVNKFLIHDDLKIEAENSLDVMFGGVLGGSPGIITGPNCDAKCEAKADSALKTFGPFYSSLGTEWHFPKEVPVYTKNRKHIDFNKYYKKGKIVPVKWELKASCGSFYDVVYSGSYYIRITGECKEKDLEGTKGE